MVIKVGEGENVQEVEIGGLNDLLSNEEFSKEFNSTVDSKISKAVDAFKEKGFKSAVEQEVETRLKNKDKKTPEQIQIEELQTQLKGVTTKAQEKELLEMRMKNEEMGRKTLKDSGLPDSLAKFFVNEDSEKSTENLKAAVEVLSDFKTNLTKGVLDKNNTKVPGNTIITPSGSLKEPGKGATKAEWLAYYKAKQK